MNNWPLAISLRPKGGCAGVATGRSRFPESGPAWFPVRRYSCSSARPPCGQPRHGATRLYRRHLVQAVGVEHCAHGAAVRVSANDDVLHAQCNHCVFQSGGHAAIHLAIRRYDVADVTRDEQVAWRTLGNQFGHDARVGAGDEHGPWRLGSRQLLEQFFLLGKTSLRKCTKPSTICFNATSALSEWLDVLDDVAECCLPMSVMSSPSLTN